MKACGLWDPLAIDNRSRTMHLCAFALAQGLQPRDFDNNQGTDALGAIAIARMSRVLHRGTANAADSNLIFLTGAWLRVARAALRERS